jgi:hypothetical protein
MNVVFHITTAGVASLVLINTNRNYSIVSVYNTGALLLSFAVGVMSHAILDYIPHCYPVNSKIDVVVGFLIICLAIIKSNKKYLVFILACLFGSVFPDIIDLSPAIVNKLIGLNLPIYDKFFPWHWQKYSGSIYSNDCFNSTVIHFALIFSILILAYLKQEKLALVLSKNETYS